MDWQGTERCESCPDPEIEGLGFCFRHVPDELLPEAEMVTGWRQCWRKGCREPAMANDRSCAGHAPPRKIIEGRVMAKLDEIMALDGDALLNPVPVENPFEELRLLAGEIKALKDRLRYMVASMNTADWRYASSRAGEMIRAEILLYERACERYATILINIVKLNIEARLARVTEQQITSMRTALDAALAETGVPLDRQDDARKAFVRHLRAAS